MRQALRQNKAKKPPTFTVQEAAPIKGWSSQKSFAEAEPDSAVILLNCFPEAEAIRARRGHVAHATGITGDVTSLLKFVSASASKMFAAAAANVYDVTSSGAVGSAVVSSKTNSWWQQSMAATPAGQFLVICNGADGVWSYNGTTWTDQTSAITGTGGAVNSFINLCIHKKRIWFIAANSTTLYYLDTDALNGPAHEFPVGGLLRRGGYVMGMGTYSVDAGDGMDDMFLVWTSEGELLIYAGTDPDTATTWQLVGSYYVGDPLGRRAMYQVGGDCLLITEDGLLPTSKAIKLDRAVVGEEAITKRIRQGYVDAVRRSRNAQGWELMAFPLANMGICNVPGGGSTPTQQFALNTITGAWGLFEGYNAYCWQHFEDALYFGANGAVYRADYGANDNGEPINIAVLPAFSHLKAQGRQKHVKDFRHYLQTDLINVSYEVAVAVDYEVPQGVSGTSGAASGDFFTWDETTWDGPSVWYGEQTFKHWTGAANIGTVVSHYTRMALDAGDNVEFKLRLLATDYLYEPGGV